MAFLISILIIFFLPTLLAVVAYQLSRLAHAKKINLILQNRTLSFDILIPTHNEPEALPYSISCARQTLKSLKPKTAKIMVGLNNWSDQNLALQSAQGADEVISISTPGKWWAIKALIQQSRAQWVMIMDAGIKLELVNVNQLINLLYQDDLIAINPTYQSSVSSLFQKIYWRFESYFKACENWAGGPISLHGACVIYRREPLLKVIDFLAKQQPWIQDDVVIPLALRATNPQGKIVYSFEMISWDQFPPVPKSEANRRHRLLIGNLEWSQLFLQQKWYKNLVLSGLVARRWLRLLGSWILIYLSLHFINIWLVGGIILGVMWLRQSVRSSVLEIFWVSLLFPVTLFSFSRKVSEVTWK